MSKSNSVPNVARIVPSPTRPLDRGRPAFTLVEILVVVLILGIAAAVIVPSIGSRDDLKVASAARLVMADLIYAQNRSITTQQKHYVVFDTAARQYRISTSPTSTAAIPHPVTKDPYVVKFGAGGTSGLEDIVLNAVSFEGKKTLAFDELGVPYYYDPAANATTATSTSGGSTVKLTCGPTQALTIVIEPYTGEIRVQ
jgi:prepilin-type N-terminal cleavage/methylation domain-containing protein